MVKGSIACTCVNLKKGLNEHFGSEWKQPVKHLCKLPIAILVQLTFKGIIIAELSQARSTMVKNIRLSMHPRNFGSAKIVRITVTSTLLLLNLINWTFMLWSIDSCQNMVYADQCHITVLRAQVYRLWFNYILGLKFICFVLGYGNVW